MRRFLLLIFLFVLGFRQVSAQSGITVYQHADYKGASKIIPDTWQATGSSAAFDNSISSIKVPKGKIVLLYENPDFSGAHKAIGSNWQAKGKDEGWNDQISAIKVLDPKKPYTMVYECFLEDPVADEWKRTNDISLLSSGRLFIGMSEVTTYEADGMAINFSPDDNMLYSGRIVFEGRGVKGWVEKPGGVKQNFYGDLQDLYLEDRIPTVPRQKFHQQPVSSPSTKPARKQTSQPAPIIINTLPKTFTTGYIIAYSGENFTRESIIIDSDWNVNQNRDWWRKIKSIRVSEGWALRIYSMADFKGYQKDLTKDWSVSKDGNWHDAVHSIKVLRRATVNQFGQSLGFIKAFKTSNYTGESIIIDSDWNARDHQGWWDSVKSVQVAEGWAIRIYSLSNFKGYQRDLTGNWSVSDDPNWHDTIQSIQIIRKPRN